MRLIIIRHGETEWNRLRRTQGTTDTALSVRGRRRRRAVFHSGTPRFFRGLRIFAFGAGNC